MQRKLIVVLILVMFLFLPLAVQSNAINYIPGLKPPQNVADAIKDGNTYLKFNYFSEKNTKGEYANPTTWNERKNIVYGLPYGDKRAGEHRCLGQTREGEDYTNPVFSHDAWAGGRIENRAWERFPWDNNEIKFKYNIQDKPRLNNRPEWLPNIVYGFRKTYPHAFANIPKAWHEYVHILQPPTYYSWGMGRAFHKVGNDYWYITVPIAPTNEFQKRVPNLYVKNLDPGTPAIKDPTTGQAVYLAEPGKTYTATVIFGVGNMAGSPDLAVIPAFVAGVQQFTDTQQARTLRSQTGSGGSIGTPAPAWPFLPGDGQSIFFRGQDTEIKASFAWTATHNTKNLVAAINYDYPSPYRIYSAKVLYEGIGGLEYSDNIVSVPVQLPPDLYVKEIRPAADYTEPGKTYDATVVYGLTAGYHQPVKAKLGLTHNGHRISAVDGQTVVLKPGDEVAFAFKFTGQSSASTLTGKIWPLEPTEKDANWANNSKEKVVPAQPVEVDLAVTKVDNINPVYTGNRYVADVFFSNNTPVPATSILRFYVNDRKIGEKTVFIGAQGRDSTQFDWQAPASTTAVKLKAVINPDHIVRESNYSNNSSSMQVEVRNPGTALCNEPNKSWTEAYYLLTEHIFDRRGRHIGDKGTTNSVTYFESLDMTVSPRDDNGRTISEIKAGYGFHLQAATSYTTDYESKVPSGLHSTAQPKGGTFPGAQEVYAIFPDKSVVFLQPAAGTDSHQNTWQLPARYRPAIGINTRKHYIDENTPDGDYVITVVAVDAGRNGLCITKKITLKVKGSMYDDTDTHLTR